MALVKASFKMKFVYVVPLLLCAALASQLTQFEPNIQTSNVLKEAIVAQFYGLAIELANIESENLVLGETITANLNDFIDRILPAVNQAFLDAGLDPTDIPDESINIVIGSSDLTQGNLTKLATIERYQNVTVSYDEDAKKVDIDFILRWEDLQLTYKYHTKVVLISITGHVIADVEHLKIHLKLGYDFNANQITIDALDFNHTGDIKLKFTGNGILDYITDAMTSIFTTIFHNLILSIVKKVAMDPVEDIVDSLNEMIDEVLNPDKYTTIQPF